MIAIIVKEFVDSTRKIGIEVHPSYSFCILINMVIFYPLIDIDVHIKIIYIDSSHIKLFKRVS